MVGINNVYYDYTIAASYDNVSDVSNPEWLNQEPSLNEDVWSKKLRNISYTMRLTDFQKYTIDKIFHTKRLAYVDDETYNRLHYVWVSSLDITYSKKENDIYPWIVEIKVISIYETSRLYYGFEMIDSVNKFQDGFERHRYMPST